MTHENRFVAEKLGEVADLLLQQNANPFRVRAYEAAADHVAVMDMSVRQILARQGRGGLEALPTIGPTIALAIEELVETGRLAQIDRLRGDLDPERLFQTVPMIGPNLAAAIHDSLKLDTLEDLEAAAHDGRLAELPGIGPRRLRGIQHSLAEILARRRPRPVHPGTPAPPVAEILDVDREYRRKAAAGTLYRIAPKRHNPTGEAWLPILHAERPPWRLTALFSNTPTAHRLGRTHDWVVIYFERDGTGEGQCTVVTETRGAQAGRRVIRGFEALCAPHSPGTAHNDKKE